MKLQEYLEKYGNVEVEEKQLNELLGIKESKVWKPNNGDMYYCINMDGDVKQTRWSNSIFDDKCYLMGNIYQTEEEAEFAVEKRKVEVELQRFAAEYNEAEIDWNNENQPKYCIYFVYINSQLKGLDANCYYVSHHNGIYFTSIEIAKQAIQAIGEDRLKKYYLGVEE